MNRGLTLKSPWNNSQPSPRTGKTNERLQAGTAAELETVLRPEKLLINPSIKIWRLK
jgi:hypothetical protein